MRDATLRPDDPVPRPSLASDFPAADYFTVSFIKELQNMNKVLLGIFIIVYSSTAFSSETIETWECKKQYGEWTNILVKALVFKGRARGEIQVAGITHDSSFQIQGFNRRWDFGGGNNKGIYKFMFIILPDGDAAYYEFGENESAKPSMLMSCRQTR